ncbi:MAG: hypothetical protein HY248_04300 [Fimbriimonas ginsengisoli]|uniref:Type II toxin-antitoxin system HicB family antitoxin n=1 Tax=Fimbriimonas ginsengisoli TaxID=1005039 RepID=A0A931LT01_FIMGI|nr:hypothetical protein [Fimbriimonas ginsengisoli]MBI3721754.1 hypothetical protein [Fimbriimonas ginsengisoli]
MIIEVLQKPEGVFVATCRDMPALRAEGSTENEARQLIEELIRDRAAEHGFVTATAEVMPDKRDDEVPGEAEP